MMWFWAILVYVVPTVIGRALIVGLVGGKKKDSIWKKLRLRLSQQNEDSEQVLSSELLVWPVYFGLGSILLLGWAAFLRYVLLSGGGDWWGWFYGGVLVAMMLAIGVNLWRLPKGILRVVTKLWAPLVIVVLVAAGITRVWVYRSSSLLNWDWYQHQLLVRELKLGNFEWRTSSISDTFQFDSYPPFAHALMAVAQGGKILGPEEMIDFWRGLEFFHLVTVGLVSWGLGLVVVNSWGFGFLNGVLGMLVFDSAFSFTNLFFLPQTLVAVVFTAIMSLLLYRLGCGKTVKWWEVVPVLGFLGSMHYVVGVFSALVFGVWVLYVWVKINRPGWLAIFPWEAILVILVVVGLVGANFVDFDSLNQGEAELYRFSLDEKREFGEHVYGYGWYLLVPLGALYVLSGKEKKLVGGVSLVMLLGLLAVVGSNLPYVVKFYTLARFWVHLFMVLGVWMLLIYVGKRWIKGLLIMVVVIVWAVMLIVNIAHWKTGLLHEGKYEHFSKYDIEASEFLRKEYGNSGVLMVSDPATQFILEGLSGINSPGGAYMTRHNRQKLVQLFDLTTESGQLDPLYEIRDGLEAASEKWLVVISGRTFSWLESRDEDKYSLKFNVWTPKSLAFDDLKRIRELEEKHGLYEVYTSPYLVIIEVEE